MPSNNIRLNYLWMKSVESLLSLIPSLSISIFHPDRHGGCFLKTVAERRAEAKRGMEREKGMVCDGMPGPA